MIDFEYLQQQLEKKPLEEVLSKLDWKEFEKFVAEIFRENNFHVKTNFRFKTKRRYEIDLIATRGNFVICADCKDWSSGRHKKTALRYAAKEQEERIKEFKRFLKKNPIAKGLLKISQTPHFVPLIISLLQEDLLIEGKTIVSPVWKLNNFLVELESYL
jgi:Holliday junction resolvase-like predicted endonuclease